MEQIVAVRTASALENIHILEDGCGQHIFLVWHGFDSVNRFYHWDYLLRYGRLVRVGLPGHGPVPQTLWAQSRNWTPRHFAEIAAAICEQYSKDGAITLVGHSTGAFLALSAAARFPSLVHSLILINPLIRSPVNFVVRSIAKTALWRRLAESVLGPEFRRKRKSVDSYLEGLRPIISDVGGFFGNPNTVQYTRAGHDDYKRTSFSAVVGTARVCATLDARRTIRDANLRVPTLIVHGENDRVSPIRQSEWLLRNLSLATLKRLPGVGHLSFAEREQEFSELITNWLSGQGLQAESA
jgi:pimeloyl-ACP methyl ester carboxylesterase